MADQPRPDSAQYSPNRAVPQIAGGAEAPPSAEAFPAEVSLPNLIRDHAGPLYRYAFRLAGQASDAEDLVQQTFLIAQQKLHQLREAERASAWLFAVLRSCFLKARRKPQPQTLSSSGDDAFPLDELVEQPEGDTTDAWLDREALQLALRELPDEFRIIVLMFYFEELSYKEIAEQLEIPIGTVMSRLSRAKAHLRKRLESTGAGVAESADRSRTSKIAN
jgi:RNA polymerase sigma-70 factor, ECF subfamily